MTNPRNPKDERALQAELDRLSSEHEKVRSDLHNSGDGKYRERLEAGAERLLEKETLVEDDLRTLASSQEIDGRPRAAV